MQPLQGKIVVITGASSGAGRALAEAFAEQGAHLVLAARSRESLDRSAEECRTLGAEVIIAPTDTRNPDEVKQLADTAASFGGTIDIWINNAGVLAAGATDEIPLAINENVIRTNLLGYMYGAQYVLPYFKSQGHGILMNNISVGGWFPTPYAAAYTASKFGLRGFFEALKAELNNFPAIHVVDLYPGFLDTPGMQHAANYTGRALQPAPPVYDPRKVARAAVQMAISPEPRKTIGAMSGFLRMAYANFPAISRNITAFTIRKYLQGANGIENTEGNVMQPVEYGMGIDGGWRLRQLPPGTKFAGAFFAGLLLAGIILQTNARR